jgi:hypothetical protein
LNANAAAFGIPYRFDEDVGQGLAVLFLKSGTVDLCDPVLMRAPLNGSDDIDAAIWSRVQDFVLSTSQIDVRKKLRIVQKPAGFTLIPGSRVCAEAVTVDIPQGSRVLASRKRQQPGAISLDEVAGNFFLKSQLDSKNQWKCEHCGRESQEFHQVWLLKAPQYLIIQLKRFSNENKIERDTSLLIGRR